MFTPKEVALRLGVPGPTLRRWRAAFRSHLSAGVDHPDAPRYSEDDIVLLDYVGRLLRSGKHTREIQEALDSGAAIVDVVARDIPVAIAPIVSAPAQVRDQQMSAPLALAPSAAAVLEDLAAAIRAQTAVSEALLEELRGRRVSLWGRLRSWRKRL